MQTLSPKIFWTIILVYLVTRLTLSMLSYRGDTSPESRERALKYFAPELIAQGTEYQRAGYWSSVAELLVTTALIIWLMLGGISAQLARTTLDFAGGRIWLQVIYYLIILIAASWVVSLPFNFYSSYIIEHRFGFSNHTPSSWLIFQLKNFMVSLVMGVLIGSIAYAFMRKFPRGWVIIIPVGALVLQLIMTVLFARLLLPIFYKIEPVKDPELAAVITAVAHKAGVEIKALHMINESKYSSHTNAFFTGFGKYKEVYLYDTLTKDHTHEEVAGILAHELGHWKYNHVFKGVMMSMIMVIAAVLFLYYGFPILARTPYFNIGPLHDVSSLPMLILLTAIIGFFTSPVESGVSRYFERQADAYGIALTKTPDVFVRDFKQLAISNRSNLLPHPATIFWRYSHPPVLERIEAAEQAVVKP